MYFYDLEKVVKRDIESLIENAVLEKKTLDYKEKFSGNSDENKKELLKDITSFANSSGGDIIYGIKENDGIPIQITGIPNREIDDKIRWIEDLVRQSVQPRIPNLKSHQVDIGDDKSILIIHIPKSWRSPHVVSFKKSFKFYARSSNGVYSLNIEELRSAFLLSDTISEKINTFKTDRIAKIIADEIPLLLFNKSRIILHIIPMTAFEITNEYIDIKSIFNTDKLSPIYYGVSNRRINFDGMIFTSNYIERHKVNSYVQIYRNGIIESVDACLLSRIESEKKYIPHYIVEKSLINSTSQYVNFLKEHIIELPYYISISLVNVKDFQIGDNSLFNNGYLVDRDILCLEPSLLIDYEVDISKLLKPMFDSIWNACGYIGSINYDGNGNFKS